MTMYLPNRDVRPTGYEAGEFLEPPPITPQDEPDTSAHGLESEDDETTTR